MFPSLQQERGLLLRALPGRSESYQGLRASAGLDRRAETLFLC